ncbi:MAG: SAM-dependent methyltransferase [Alphaproteobacteria bacterium]|nr:SAM-dependent methyltransferase [Alphaproteobacteria bacterium]
MTKLAAVVADIIAAEGPMPLDRYMALCLGHPTLGYYMTRDPFGAAGDFTTSPEISQVFGELVGVWLINSWMALDSPSPFALVELGPGRGTLMADVLRVAKSLPAFASALQVHLVETSPVLRQVQHEKLGKVTWHDHVGSLPELPCLIVANEFFDALPIKQFENRGSRWFERHVGVGEGQLKMGLVAVPPREGGEGVYEVSPVSLAVAEDLGAHIAKHGGAALVIDYGHLASAAGDTLQAMKAHEFVSVLDHAGEADVTAHVDFEALARAFRSGSVDLLPMLTQGQFLNAMGLEMRVQKLSAKLQGAARQDFVIGAERLAAPDKMGSLFKVMAIAQKNRQPLYPFEAA